MPQIKTIGFTNFRVFKENIQFGIAPITVFTGTNSSGKSSIFKGLMLLKDSIDDLSILNFSGEKHNLGTFSNSKARSSEDKQIIFEFTLVKPNERNIFLDNIDCEFFYVQDNENPDNGILKQSTLYFADRRGEVDSGEDVLILVSREDEKDVVYFNMKHFFGILKNKILPEFNSIKDDIKFINERTSTASIENTLLAYKYIPYYKELDKICTYNFEIISAERLGLKLPNLPMDGLKNFANLIQENVFLSLTKFVVPKDLGLEDYGFSFVSTYQDLLDQYVRFVTLGDGAFKHITSTEILYFIDDEQKHFYKDDLNSILISEVVNQDFFTICRDLIIPELTKILENLKSEIKNIGYIEGIRSNSQRLYTNQSQGTSFNQLLLKVGQKWISKLKTESQGLSPYDFVQKWIKNFEIGDEVDVTRLKGIATEVKIIRCGISIDLIDLGYGATQFLPLLLMIASNYKLKGNTNPYMIDEDFEIKSSNGPLLLIEEPESNLHPKLQSLLADFFVDVAKHFHVTLLIETHSEYFIRRLQVLTAAKEVKPEESVIYYLNGESEKTGDDFVTKININPDGSLTNDFGPGFIDEATNWKMELMRLKHASVQNLN